MPTLLTRTVSAELFLQEVTNRFTHAASTFLDPNRILTTSEIINDAGEEKNVQFSPATCKRRKKKSQRRRSVNIAGYSMRHVISQFSANSVPLERGTEFVVDNGHTRIATNSMLGKQVPGNLFVRGIGRYGGKKPISVISVFNKLFGDPQLPTYKERQKDFFAAVKEKRMNTIEDLHNINPYLEDETLTNLHQKIQSVLLLLNFVEIMRRPSCTEESSYRNKLLRRENLLCLWALTLELLAHGAIGVKEVFSRDSIYSLFTGRQLASKPDSYFASKIHEVIKKYMDTFHADKLDIKDESVIIIPSTEAIHQSLVQTFGIENSPESPGRPYKTPNKSQGRRVILFSRSNTLSEQFSEEAETEQYDENTNLNRRSSNRIKNSNKRAREEEPDRQLASMRSTR